MPKKRYSYILSLLLFFAFLVLFFAMPKANFSAIENRVLEPMPKVSLNSISDGNFTKGLDKYIEDHFPLRHIFLKVHALNEYMFNVREKNGAIIGKDGQLFEQAQLSKQNIAFNLDAIDEFPFGLNTYLLVVPNPSLIYENRLPFGYANRSGFNEILHYPLNNVQKINVLPTFLEHRGENLFYKTDHHWTAESAKLAYEKLTQVLHLPYLNYAILKSVPNFKGSLFAKTMSLHAKNENLTYFENPKAKYFIDGKEQHFVNEQKLTEHDKYAALMQGNPKYAHIVGDGEGKLLVLKDSFANALLPLLSQNFKEIDIVDLRYYNDNLEKLIENFKPNVTLLVYGERSLTGERSIGFALTRMEKK